jgi:hypothetical protein
MHARDQACKRVTAWWTAVHKQVNRPRSEVRVVGALRDMDNVGEAILVLWKRGTS